MPDAFDLEKVIAAWRAETVSRNIRNGSLEELERHLRDAFQEIRSGDVPDWEAWERAMADLGDPGKLAPEYARLDRFRVWDYIALSTIGVALWAVMRLVIPQAIPSRGIEGAVANQPLLAVHIVSVSLAACFAVLVGFCGAFVLSRRRLSNDPCGRVEALFRKLVIVFSGVVFVGSLGGFVAGLVWAEAIGGIQTPWYDPRVLGCIALILWSGASLWFNVRRKIDAKWLFRLAIVGSGIVTETWLALLIFGGGFGFETAGIALILYSLQLAPFCCNWNEDFPTKIA